MKAPTSRLPLALCALGGALALASCTPIQTENTVTPDKNVVAGNTVIPNAANAVDNATTENAATDNSATTNAVAATPAPSAGVKFAYVETIYVPGDDGMLHAHKVSRMAIDSQLKSGGNGAPALQEIIERAPQYFPPGAKVNDWKDGQTITVDLNGAFDKPDFWSQKGENTTQLALYALVNSAAKTTGAGGTSPAKMVQFTIDKKPVPSLGEYDLSGALKPLPKMIAK